LKRKIFTKKILEKSHGEETYRKYLEKENLDEVKCKASFLPARKIKLPVLKKKRKPNTSLQ
jgi:hypothetical protein